MNEVPSTDRAARVLAAFALALTAIAAWVAIDARNSVHSSESAAGGRLSELGAEGQAAKAAITQLQGQLRESQQRLTELEARLADTQDQRVALEEMYRELSRSADDRVLSEVEQMLVLASQQLQLAGQRARRARGAADGRPAARASADKLAATPLRRAITQDMERLKAVPQLDTVGLTVKLDGLIAQTDSLPLFIAETPPAPRSVRVRTTDENGLRARLAGFLGGDEGPGAHPRARHPGARAALARPELFPAREPQAAAAGRARVAARARRGRAAARTCAPPRRGSRSTSIRRRARRRPPLATLKQLAETPMPDRRARHQREPRGRAHGARGTRESARAMRFAIWAIILAAVAVGIALLARNSTGYVVIFSGNHRIELSLNLLVFLVFAGYFAFYVLARFTAALLAIPARVRAYRAERVRTQASPVAQRRAARVLPGPLCVGREERGHRAHRRRDQGCRGDHRGAQRPRAGALHRARAVPRAGQGLRAGRGPGAPHDARRPAGLPGPARRSARGAEGSLGARCAQPAAACA